MYQSLHLLNPLTAAFSSCCLKMNQLNYSCDYVHPDGLELPLYRWLQELSLCFGIVKMIENWCVFVLWFFFFPVVIPEHTACSRSLEKTLEL